MEWISFLETSKDYNDSDVICAFHKCIELGQKALEEKGENLFAEIIKEFRNNSLIIEREII